MSILTSRLYGEKTYRYPGLAGMDTTCSADEDALGAEGAVIQTCGRHPLGRPSGEHAPRTKGSSANASIVAVASCTARRCARHRPHAGWSNLADAGLGRREARDSEARRVCGPPPGGRADDSSCCLGRGGPVRPSVLRRTVVLRRGRTPARGSGEAFVGDAGQSTY